MKKNDLAVFLPLAIFILLIPSVSTAKEHGKNQWFISPRIGTAFLMSEVNSSFTAVPKDFQNGMGFSADLSLSRTVGSHLELGLRGGFYQLSSTNDSLMINDLSSFFPLGNERYQDSRFHGLTYFYNAPIEYSTSCLTANLFLRYYFIGLSSSARDVQKIQPYVELSVGQNWMNTELTYKDPSNFTTQYGQLPSVWIPYPYVEGKNVAPYQSPEVNLQYALAFGSRIHLESGMILTLAAEISSVQTQYLDGTPNVYADDVQAGIVPRIMLGVSIPLGEGHARGNKYLPWGP